MYRLSIVTFNARGLRARRKRRSIFRHLHLSYPNSVICLQETHSLEADEQLWRMEWGGDIVFSHGTENASGVAFLFPIKNSFNVGEVTKGIDGRMLIIEVKSNVCDVVLVGIYAPARDNQEVKCKFLDEFKRKIITMPNDRMVICGDFNIKLGPRDTDSKFQQCRAGRTLQNLVKEYDFVDIWRKANPNVRKYTWRRTRPLQQSRLDYVFVSECLYRGRQTKVCIDPGFLSDHSFVYAEIDARVSVRGPGIWRFNNLLLDDEKFVTEAKDELRKCKDGEAPYESHGHSKGLLFEILLSNIRSKAMRRGKEVKSEQRKEEKEMTEKVMRLEHRLEPERPETIRAYERAVNELDELKLKKGKLAILASGARWVEQGEKLSKYFLNLCKKRSVQKSIVSLKSSTGEILDDSKSILEYCAKYFRTLFKSDGVELESMNAFSLDESGPRLSEEERLSCEGIITAEECLSALKGMGKDKAPGITGFTTEFYTAFWEDLKDLLVEYINEAFVRKHFFITHVRGIIHLIPKKGDQMQLKNKRPICLIDVLYKIVAKVLASRLSTTLNKLVNQDQTGFVKGRYIGENLRLVSDIITYCNKENLEGILLTIDFKNAFDTLERDFIAFALNSFKFGEQFCDWIRLLYQDAQLSVINDGVTSEWFPCERGTFQGSPISGMLFILAIELLANRIRRCKEVEGITVSGIEVKVSLYADDMTVFLKNTDSLGVCLSIIEEFRKASGLEINISKTKIMWLGTLKGQQESCYDIEPVDEVKILGSKFSAKKDCYKDNVEPLVDKIVKVTNSWGQRNLTIKGRITVAKSLLMSQVIFLGSICEFERKDLERIQTHIMRFIWRGRPPKVAKRVMWQDVGHGGLNAPCVDAMLKALRITWVRRMHMNRDSSWRCILQAKIGEFQLDDLLRIQKSRLALKSWKIPQFYKDAIWDFQKLNSGTVVNGTDVKERIVWYNDDILVNARPVFISDMYRAGLKRISDILRPNGTFYSFDELKQKYPELRVNCLGYQGLVCSIPAKWRRLVRGSNYRCAQGNEPIQCMFGDAVFPLTELRSRHAYSLLIENRKPAAEQRWEREGYFVNWRKIYEVPYGCTMSTRLQSLQFRVLHRYIPTMRFLNVRHIKESPMCPRCDVEESIRHFLFDCQDIKPIWLHILRRLKSTFKLCDDFVQAKTVIFGYCRTKPIVNLIILLVKQCVVSTKSKEVRTNITIEMIKSGIEQQFKIEKQIATRCKTIDKFITRWGGVLAENGNLDFNKIMS